MTAVQRLIRGRLRLAALLLGLLVVFLGFSSTKADASPGQVTHRVDATGAVFACNDGSSYTVTSGSITIVSHDSTDAAGGEHVTGTIAPSGVRLIHSTDNGTYRLAGASWFGGNLTAGGTTEFADTAHFVILGPNGPVANVSETFVFVMNAQGVVTVSFDKNTGTCQEPAD
jgi:hypothetical protein